VHGWVDLLRPGVDAAKEVVDPLEASGTQLMHTARGTYASAAEEHIGLLRIELLQALPETLDGNVDRAWQGGNLLLDRVAHVDQ